MIQSRRALVYAKTRLLVCSYQTSLKWLLIELFWWYHGLCWWDVRAYELRLKHEAHLHWQKPKSKKPGFFVVPFTLPEKPITFGVFGTKSACAKKPESHTCVLVSGAHARLLSTFDCTRVVRITSRATVGWFRWRSRATWPKTRIIPARLERAFTLAKKEWNVGGVLKNHAAEVGFSIRFFWSV